MKTVNVIAGIPGEMRVKSMNFEPTRRNKGYHIHPHPNTGSYTSTASNREYVRIFAMKRVTTIYNQKDMLETFDQYKKERLEIVVALFKADKPIDIDLSHKKLKYWIKYFGPYLQYEIEKKSKLEGDSIGVYAKQKLDKIAEESDGDSTDDSDDSGEDRAKDSDEENDDEIVSDETDSDADSPRPVRLRPAKIPLPKYHPRVRAVRPISPAEKREPEPAKEKEKKEEQNEKKEKEKINEKKSKKQAKIDRIKNLTEDVQMQRIDDISDIDYF